MLAKPYHLTSVKISPEFYGLCKKHHIRISEAVRAGISLLLAERGVLEYNNDLNIVRKRAQLSLKIQELVDEIAKLKDGKQQLHKGQEERVQDS